MRCVLLLLACLALLTAAYPNFPFRPIVVSKSSTSAHALLPEEEAPPPASAIAEGGEASGAHDIAQLLFGSVCSLFLVQTTVYCF